MRVFAEPSFWVSVAVTAGIFGILALGFQIQFGYTGLANFGHVAFMAIGAYATAILAVRLSLPWWAAALLALGSTAAFGVCVGAVSARVRLEYFALAALAFAELVRYLIQNMSWLTGGTQGSPAMLGSGEVANYASGWQSFLTGLQSRLESIFGPDTPPDTGMLMIVLVVGGVCFAVVGMLVSSPWGRVIRAIRDDDVAVAARGINPAPYRLQATVIGAVLGSVAGSLYAFHILVLFPSEFASEITMYAVIIVLLGGLGRVWGVVLGTILFSTIYSGSRFIDIGPLDSLSDAGRAQIRVAIIGALFIALALFRPQGLLGRREELPFE